MITRIDNQYNGHVQYDQALPSDLKIKFLLTIQLLVGATFPNKFSMAGFSRTKRLQTDWQQLW